MYKFSDYLPSWLHLKKGRETVEVIDRKVSELIPYTNNPRHNDSAVDAVAASIKEFGFKVPIIVDKDGVIVAGHTRLKAAQKLGLKTVPCIVADDLTPEQVKAFRLADNKVGELAGWDFEKLDLELEELDFDMTPFGFDEEVDEEVDEASANDIDGGGEISTDDFNDGEFECTCPRCGFKFNK